MKNKFTLIDILSGCFSFLYKFFIVVIFVHLISFSLDIFAGIDSPMNINLFVSTNLSLPIEYTLTGGSSFSEISNVFISPQFNFGDSILYKLVASIDSLVMLIILLFLIKSFKNIFKRMQKLPKIENVFNSLNYKSIRNISFLIISYNLYVFIKSAIFASFVLENIMIMDKELSFSPNYGSFAGLFTGLMVYVIAQVYKQGIQLKEENELTI